VRSTWNLVKAVQIVYKLGKLLRCVGGNPVYCVKTGPDSPTDAGSVVQTTVTKRIIPAGAEKQPTFEFWEYLASLTFQDWSKHILYLYRTEPCGPGGQGVSMGKFVDTSVIPWNDREEAEIALMQKFGGRMFRVIVKRNSERIGEGKIFIDAQPRTLAAPPSAAEPQPGQTQVYGVAGGEGTATERVASQAMSTIAAQEPQGVRLAMEALSTTANVLKGFADRPAPAAPAPSETDNLIKMMMIKMMEKMMDRFDAPAVAVSPIPGVSGDMFSRFFTTIIERGLNPPAVGNGESKISTGTELVRQMPQIGSYVVQAMTAWQHGREAERDIVLATTRGTPPGPIAVPQIPARVQQNPVTVNAPQPAQNPTPINGAAVGKPSLEFVEQKIMELFNAPISAEAAAEEVLAFLQVMDGPAPAPGEVPMVAQLVSQGEAGLLTLFQFRPILQPATLNAPRLAEFIRAFLKYAGENGGEAEPAIAKPSLPN